jgi:hypothetical protein
MTTKTTTNPFIRSGLALAFALAVWSPVQARSADPMAGKSMTKAQMMDHCKEMKAQKQKMTEDMKVQDAQLTEELAKMNGAPEKKKLDLMAAVVTRMAEQRIAMDARHAKMQEEMMAHMMQHMARGKNAGFACPMMKEEEQK